MRHLVRLGISPQTSPSRSARLVSGPFQGRLRSNAGQHRQPLHSGHNEFLSGQLNITKDQAMAQIAQANFLKLPATVQDTANAAVLIASDRARMLTGTVLNATAGAALD